MSSRKKRFEQRFHFKPTPSLYTKSKVLKPTSLALDPLKVQNLKKTKNEKKKDIKPKKIKQKKSLQRSMTPRRILRENASDYV